MKGSTDMFIKKVKYEMDKMKLENRIEYLENLICPNGKHEYEQIDTILEGGTGIGDERMVRKFRCLKCGKVISN